MNNPILTIIAIILGVAAFRQFDFETFRFEKLGLGIVYLLGFLLSIYFLIKNRKNSENSDQ